MGFNTDATFISPPHDPFAWFHAWYAEAVASEPNDANAMALATVDGGGVPSVRMVLLKDYSASVAEADRGFVFYTNYASNKGHAITANHSVSACIHWKSLLRQVRITGVAEQVSATQSDAYFASRNRDSQLGAWASDQSRELVDGRDTFEQRLQEFADKFQGMPVPRPPHWGGYRIRVSQIELWQQRPNRWHDRIIYTLQDDGSWTWTRLYP